MRGEFCRGDAVVVELSKDGDGFVFDEFPGFELSGGVGDAFSDLLEGGGVGGGGHRFGGERDFDSMGAGGRSVS